MPDSGSYLGDEDLRKFAEYAVDANVVVSDKCGYCQFWEPLENPTWSDHLKQLSSLSGEPDAANPRFVTYQGECRRRAPGVADDPSTHPMPVWPWTDWNDWCGEQKCVRFSLPVVIQEESDAN